MVAMDSVPQPMFSDNPLFRFSETAVNRAHSRPLLNKPHESPRISRHVSKNRTHFSFVMMGKSLVLIAGLNIFELNIYRGADKSLARPRRKQANVSVRMA